MVEPEQEQKAEGGAAQFLRAYWTLTKLYHGRMLAVASIITVMQVLAIFEPGIITSMIQDAIRGGAHAKQSIGIKLALIVLVVILKSGIQWAKSRVERRIAIDLEHRLAIRFLEQLLHLGGVFHETHNVGELQGTIGRGVAKVTEITFLLSKDLVPLIGMFVVTVITVTWYSWVSTIVIVVICTLFIALTLLTRAHKMKDRLARHNLKRKVDRLFGNIVSCVRTVWIFGQEEREIARLGELQDRIKLMIDREMSFYDKTDVWRNTLIDLGRVGVVAVCLVQAFYDQAMLTNLFLVYVLADRLFRMCYNVGNIFDRYVEAINPVEEMMKVLAAKSAIVGAEHPVPVPEVGNGIVYRDGCYAYPLRADYLALNHINLAIEPGRTTALVGGSGSGKTTATKVLVRFIQLDQGTLLINGVDVRNIAIKVLRRLIGVVSQDVEIFDMSIADNIAYGKPEATRAQIIAAAKLANIHDKIMTFAGGYDALVGHDGQQLSGGERQRIAIARVLLVDPEVIVFDEATAFVDAESDLAIHEAVELLAKRRKTIVKIAHRLGTVRNADKIYFLEHGSVIESGTHDELVKRRGRYFALWTAHERGSHGQSARTTGGAGSN